MSTALIFTVEGTPVTEPNKIRFTKNGRAYRGCPKLKEWKKAVVLAFRAKKTATFPIKKGTPVEIHYTFILPPVKGDQWPIKRHKSPDLDNLAYSVTNALKGEAYEDDVQIVIETHFKRFITNGEKSGVIVLIREIA